MTRPDLSDADREDRAESHDPKCCKTCRTLNPEDGPAELYLDCGHIKRAFMAQLVGRREWCDGCDDWAFVTDPDPREPFTDEEVTRMDAADRKAKREAAAQRRSERA